MSKRASKSARALTARQRVGTSERDWQRGYIFGRDEEQERERVRQANLARGVQHLVDERNSDGYRPVAGHYEVRAK